MKLSVSWKNLKRTGFYERVGSVSGARSGGCPGTDVSLQSPSPAQVLLAAEMQGWSLHLRSLAQEATPQRQHSSLPSCLILASSSDQKCIPSCCTYLEHTQTWDSQAPSSEARQWKGQHLRQSLAAAPKLLARFILRVEVFMLHCVGSDMPACNLSSNTI